jgi:hypothetical protein
MIQKIKDFVHSPDYTAWLISTGLVLFVIHNRAQPFRNYIFLPQVGLALIVFSLIEAWNDSRKLKQRITLGSKWIWIPMLVIVSMCWLRVPVYGFANTDIAGALFFSLMFALYLASRLLGQKILIAFLPALIIEAITVIVQGLVYPGLFSGGILTSPPDLIKWANYELANGFLLFGFLIYQGNYKWELGTLIIVAIFFTGAPEAVFLVPLMGLLMLIRRDLDWSKIAVSLCIVAAIAVSWQVAGGYTKKLWLRTPEAFTSFNDPVKKQFEYESRWIILNPIWSRIIGYQYTIGRASLLGYGVQIVGNNPLTAHNVPLIIVDQIGIPAAIAWCVATGYLVLKSKQKYLWIMFIAMGVIDHYTWDNAAVWWWTIAGTSMVTNIKNDYIFKNES